MLPTVFDISPPILASSPVFPGDTPYSQHWCATISSSCPVNVSSITMSPHVGAHADAPLHYDPNGSSIGEVSLETFLGRCRVIHAIGYGGTIEWNHLKHAITDSLPERVLVRTYVKAPNIWDPDFAAYHPETVIKLADMGVKLIGIDTASIDPAKSITLDSHMIARQRNLRLLENFVLDDVPEGDYELIALPLRLVHADASPVRALLRSMR